MTLIKSVLNSIPVYFFIQDPEEGGTQAGETRMMFPVGRRYEHTKIAWVS